MRVIYVRTPDDIWYLCLIPAALTSPYAIFCIILITRILVMLSVKEDMLNGSRGIN